jgi:hypothetical protein
MAENKSGSRSGPTVDIRDNEQLYALPIDKDQVCPKRQRKPTERGMDYKIELLKRNSSAAHGKLLLYIQKIKDLLKDGANMEDLGHARDELDHRMESFVEVHGRYNDLLISTEDRDHSYQWFETRNREYDQCRLKVCERIHELERELYNKPSSIRSSVRSMSSSSSAHSRRVKAAATAAKLKVEMKFLDQEVELERLQIKKQIEMANAEEQAMLKIEEEEGILPSHTNPDKTMESASAVPEESSANMNIERMPTTSTDKRGELKPIIPPFTMNVTPQHDESTEHCDSNPRNGTDNNVINQSTISFPLAANDTALQEMIKL